MATKKENKRYVVRRVRRALNNAEVPPSIASRKLIRYGYGTGTDAKGVDARDGSNDPDIYKHDDDDCAVGCWGEILDGYRDPANCSMGEWCDCFLTTTSGEGWGLNGINDNKPPLLLDIMEA